MVVRFDRTHFSPSESRRLGLNLSAVRKAAGVSLSALARWLNLPETTVGAYEAGRARFPLRLVFAAARALRVTPYQLLAGASDRVLNPWGPNVVEWRRVGRSEDDRLDGPSGDDEWGEEPSDEDGPKQVSHAKEEFGDGQMEVLRGDEAGRAIEFLDEPGPSGRFDAEEDEGW